MSAPPAPDEAPSDRVNDVPRMLRAVNRAIREAVEMHRRAGNPIAIVEDGRVVWIPPEEIPPYTPGEDDEDP